MRIILIIGLCLATGCTATPTGPELEEGAVVTRVTPQDLKQCNAQPALVWCRAECQINPQRNWCDQ